MRVHLVNPNHLSFGIGVITPRWLYVLAAATPRSYGDPVLVDETLAPIDSAQIRPGDVVGIGIHSGNALRGYEIGRAARERGAHVIYGGIHASLYPQEPCQFGGAHAVVKGDGDTVWAKVLDDCRNGSLQQIYEGGRIEAGESLPARWELMPPDSYMWASVQTVRGCPKHCSFCSVWRTDGQRPRQRASDVVIREIVQLRRMGFRFIALADDNFYPVTLEDLELAKRQNNQSRLEQLRAMRQERFELMARLADLPPEMVFFTQITMEAAEDPEFLDAMRRARIKGALVGVESVTPEGLKAIHKGFNSSGHDLVQRLRTFRQHDIHVLGSFIFGLPSDRPDTFQATAALAAEADVTFAQFVMLTPFPGTVDFQRWEKLMETDPTRIEGIPLTRYWLIPQALRPKVYMSHPRMSANEIRRRTQDVWDRFYSLRSVWKRSRCVKSLRSRLAFVLISKLYRQMYANTGIATDSARGNRAARWARWLAKPCRRLFQAPPLPETT
ncbi:MAG: B12-binding domain-containing radical SAM protein [Acidobacteria bacterium]|nr:B12-binding domain-containing radical SAM protein [Acidobacteriota bacterium]MBI3655247.1 B12-binding domain-containing radical SAM protein [Acidobacteriota bacterium]